MQNKIAVILNVWENDEGDSEIQLVHPSGTEGYPYADSHEERDQYLNAKQYAEVLKARNEITLLFDIVELQAQWSSTLK